MDRYEIESNLCIYDFRNPDWIDDIRDIHCSCDNCFYGCNKLANELLDKLDRIEELENFKREILNK